MVFVNRSNSIIFPKVDLGSWKQVQSHFCPCYLRICLISSVLYFEKCPLDSLQFTVPVACSVQF